jgi:hypothetical protein
VEYGVDGYLTDFSRANITQHCDWTPSIGFRVRWLVLLRHVVVFMVE